MVSRHRLQERFAFASRAVHDRRRRRPVLEVLEGRALLATFTVNSWGDAGSGSNNSGDLRYCINQANANDQANTIVFDSTLFSAPQTTALSGGQLELSDTGGTQTITGPAAELTISGGEGNVFQVDHGVTASISGLTIAGGFAQKHGGGLANYGTAALTDCTLSSNSDGIGGGVFNSGTGNLTLTDCTVSGAISSGVYNLGTANLTDCTLSGNYAYFGGGGVYNIGTATLTDCTISNNYAQMGGGVANSGTGNLTVTGCTVSYNSASGGEAGGVANSGTANLTDCTISGNDASSGGGGGVLNSAAGNLTLTGCNVSGNTAYNGGGVNNLGTSSLTDCTISGNSLAIGGAGGGVYNLGTVNLTDCTISGNSGVSGGLANQSSYGYQSTATLTDTIVAGNTGIGASDIGGNENVSGSNNLIGTGGTGGLANGVDGNIVLTNLTDLGLDQLGENGGPTETMALLPGSAAIGAGAIADYPGTATAITTDQRGAPLDSPNPDIGAFQTKSSTLISLTFSGISNNSSITYGASSVTVSGTLADGSQAPVGETVALTLDGVQQSATIGSGGAFSTTFDTTALTVANSPDTITYAYTSDANFASASTTSTLTVTPATLTITAAPETKVYGTADPALAYTASGFQFSDTAASVLTGTLARAQAGTLAGEHAGSYAIIQGTLAADSNYTISFTGKMLTIASAPLTVTAKPESKLYGTADPALTDTPAGLVDQKVDGVTIDDTAATVLTGALARAQFGTASGEQVGDYAITQGTLAADNNYTIAFTGSTLAITPAPLTVAANPQTKVYGHDDPTFTVTATGLVDTAVDGVTIDDTAVSALTGHLARTLGETVSGGPYAIARGTLAASNYTITFTGSTLSITPAPLTVTANPQTKVYGTADPTLTDTVAGLVDTTVEGVTIDDTAATVLAGALARAQSGTLAGEQVGHYAIIQGALAADSNYTITFTAGALTITPAPLTVTAKPKTKVYGIADPALTDTVAGFVDSTVDGATIDDTAGTVLTGNLARGAGETVSGGPYAITQGTLAANSNYTIRFTGSTLTITPATPLLSAIAPGGTYSGATISATAKLTGVNGTATPSLEDVTPTLTYYAGTGTSGADLGSRAPSAVGTYTVVARFPGSADYAAVQSKPATFVIAPAAATIILTSQSSSPVYGQAVTFVATVNSAGGAPGGTVTFADGTTPLATVPLNGAGQAALTISTLSLGSHAITATYSGDTDSLGVKSEMAAETVGPAATTIVLEPHAVLKGKKNLKDVELTATIEPVALGGGVPTGTVTFEFLTKSRNKVKVTKLRTAELSGGAATLTFKPNAVLNKTLTIVYSGDSDFLAGTMSAPKLTKSRIASSRI